MGRARSLVVIGAVAALAAGCGGSGGSGARLRAGSSPAGGGGSLIVSTSLSARADGAMYTEGALAEVTLRGPDGAAIATKRASPGRRIVFPGLAAGHYTVEPALRPCDGTCIHLDPRVDGCRQAVWVTGHATLAVRFVVGSPCALVPAPRLDPVPRAGRTDG